MVNMGGSVAHSALILCGLFALLASAESGKILFFCPFVSKSITITYTPVVKELANRGHQVVVVAANRAKELDVANVKQIVAENNLEEVLNKNSEEQLQGKSNPLAMLAIFDTIFELIDLGLGHPEFQTMLRDPSTKFDAVMVVPFFGNEAGYYFSHKYGAPLILYFTGQVSVSWVDEALGQPHNTAYLPTAVLPYTSDMTFVQRVINTFGNFLFHRVLRNTYVLGRDYAVLKKHFPDEEIPDLIELEKNASLSFSFSHPFLMDGWRPYAPNHVNLGMMNCLEIKNLDPQDAVLKFLDNAKEGVIYVSFGTVIRAAHMSAEKRAMFLSAFKKLKQKVLWKWETDEMEGKPDNVMLSKWLPQQNVLAHPNVKLFVTHGGQSSFQEALCHKKPLVVIPVAGDQPANGAESERLGIGINIGFRDVTEENLSRALESVLNDPSYLKASQELGDVLVDQINRPLDRAVWWIEHVMRHPTLYKRRSPVHNLAWYQYFLLDVLAFYCVLLTLIALLFVQVVKCCCCRKTRQRKNKRD